jgi:Chalcone isomerase-like
MNIKTRKLLLISIILTTLLIPFPDIARAGLDKSQSAGTITISGVVMDKTVQIDGHTCNLIGAGLLRYRTVFRAYVAALYLEKKHTSGDLFKDIPKSLVIEYFHAIDAQGFISATRQGFKNNLSKEQLEAIDQSARAFYSLYRDVKPSDRYSFTYIPGKGSELALNGRVLGKISGLDFANAFLSIWLGPNPLNQTLKKALLGEN